MVLVITHDFAHRLTRAGIVESAIFNGQTIEDWRQRGKEEMGMTGGDEAFVRETLVRLSQIFREGYKLPSVEVPKPVVAEPLRPV